jgi:hypothetical protein
LYAHMNNKKIKIKKKFENSLSSQYNSYLILIVFQHNFTWLLQSSKYSIPKRM